MLEDYRKARKAGIKQLQRDVSAGRYPYPPALDDILKGEGSQGEIPIGLAEIDMSLIAGTKTRGRQNMFSSGFMPLPEATSEFASKWSDLIDSQREEGLRDPIIVYEFLQRFYVQEGNKRVSVMRYLNMPSILASITRVVPMPSDSKSYHIYQEFTRFYSVAPVYGILFDEEGRYAKLAAALGETLDKPWPEEKVRSLATVFYMFSSAWRRFGGTYLDMAIGEGLLTYLKIYNLDDLALASQQDVDEKVQRIWSEFVVSSKPDAIDYLENPTPSKPKLLPELKTLYKGAVLAKPFSVAFIYEGNPVIDGWEALHDKARVKLENRLGATVKTMTFPDCKADDEFDWAVESAVEADCDLIVTIHPTQMTQALRAAVAHPDVAVINCSVSLSHSAVRTFYGRMYEAKFLLGALAAAMADNHKVGYVAETPVFSTVSEINAFAIGASMIDPKATIYLKWFTAKDYDWKRELREEGVRIVSARDYPVPSRPDEAWGLYRVEDDGSTTHLAEPVWMWGRYYELIIQSIRNDAWVRESHMRPNKALNYWWGMRTGVLDVKLSEDLPHGQRVLNEVIRQSILTGRIDPFTGKLVSQTGVVQEEGDEKLSSEEIVRMRWLNENVVGRLPEQKELSEDGLEKVEVAGVIPLDPTVVVTGSARTV
ncbi:BMP family ABC transporter substrate-binding protein [Collinsella sp. An2]|uniref:BMP family ABC transporter substrate-binding protein n=1 Tax=Collinsella sp. An2 TaxID=1965585 RepID=UPI000B3871C1|nr:BMP family ABC transporter substrate-binding protein [Collinsella sp. An2]OUP10483.1 BMP family ABC transporter substrate-binding protein [Collinsella sp. An2]